MKKIFALMVCLALLMVPVCSSYAAGVDAWDINEGYEVDGETVKHELSQNDEGLVIYSKAGYWGDPAWSADAGFGGMKGGVWMKDALAKSDELVIKFRFDKCSQGREKEDGEGLDDADQWFSVQLLSGPTFMDFDNRDKGTGLNVLVRPSYSHADGKMIQFQPHIFTDEAFENKNDTTAWMVDPIGAEVTLKIVKNDEGKWDVYGIVNGEETKATQNESIDQPVLGDKVYLALGLSNNWKEEMQVTVLEINGESMAASDDVPKAGQDYTFAIILGAVAVLLAGAGATMYIMNKKSA